MFYGKNLAILSNFEMNLCLSRIKSGWELSELYTFTFKLADDES